MERVDNKYIDNAIKHLLNTTGVKNFVDDKLIMSLIRSKKTKEAIKEIAKYLGLPIEVNLSYVSKEYKPNSNDGFQSSHLVKTDWRGRGTEGITAQVSIPLNLPLYGAPEMINFPINVRLSENCTENPSTLITIMAHELSHIVLHSLLHKEKENEIYTDLTAMMLGFSDIMKIGRKVVKTNSFTNHSFFSSQTTTTIQTTTYGYLSDDNFSFAYDRIKGILSTYKKNKLKLLKKINELEKAVQKQKKKFAYFKKYINYLDKNLNQKISQQDSYWITTFHQVNYADDFISAIRKIEKELKQFRFSVKDFNHCSDIHNKEAKLKSITSDLNSKYDQIRGAVIILKKYVSKWHRFLLFLKIELKIGINN